MGNGDVGHSVRLLVVLDPLRWGCGLQSEIVLGTLSPRCELERDERHADERTLSPPPPNTQPMQPAGAN